MLEDSNFGSFFTWVAGGILTAQCLVVGFLNRKIDSVDSKADNIMKLHDAHVLHVEQTYAKAPAMKESFEMAGKAAEKVAAALDAKLDKTQDAVQGIALEQAKQGENIKSMGNSIKDIALSIKDKSS